MLSGLPFINYIHLSALFSMLGALEIVKVNIHTRKGGESTGSIILYV